MSSSNSVVLHLKVFGSVPTNPSADRRRFPLQGSPELVGSSLHVQNRDQSLRTTNTLAEGAIDQVSLGGGVGVINGNDVTQDSIPPMEQAVAGLPTVYDQSPSLSQRLHRMLANMPADERGEHLVNGGPEALPPPVHGNGADRQKPFTRHVRPFPSPNTAGATVWYESSGSAPLLQPDLSIIPEVGDLYFHKECNNLQLWISTKKGEWTKKPVEYVEKYLPDRVVKDLVHPGFENRLLKLRLSGEPSWVTRQTLATLKSRKKGGVTQQNS